MFRFIQNTKIFRVSWGSESSFRVFFLSLETKIQNAK